MDVIADTSFLVGLWRRQPWAFEFAQKQPDLAIGIPWVVLGEFWHGAVKAGHDEARVRRFLRLGVPLMDPAPVISSYATLCAHLQEQGVYKKMGQNDLWIAAVALEAGRPLVTRNTRHFGAIEELDVLALESSSTST